MMNEELYLFLDSYRHESGLKGFKVNKKKNRVSIYPNLSAFMGFLGILFLGLGIFMFVYGEILVGVLGVVMGLFLFGGLTQRTVFDIGEKMVFKSFFFFIDTEIMERKWFTHFHTTLSTVSVGGVKRIRSYLFDLQYKQSSADEEAMMKSIASFPDYEGLEKFAGVVFRILKEMDRD